MRCSSSLSGGGAPAATILLALAGIATFLTGFFPLKPTVKGYSSTPAYTASNDGQRPITRLAFVLVDALRSDFAFGQDSDMHFVKHLVASGHVMPYTAIAQAPTVTLPRLKAITTGSNPTFLDAILNIAEDSHSSAVLEHTDSWLRQLVTSARHNRTLFAGDDTWLRLFPPHWFKQFDPVSSFFVADYTTVDHNVTRHLDSWLTPTSFDVVILHYLGLDHIGHLGGPRHPQMKLKQAEMDDVIKRLYEHLAEQDSRDGGNSLIVLTGDHGMTEIGNHGGSTSAETSTALAFIAPSMTTVPAPDNTSGQPYLFFERVQQLDLVPTLAILMGVGIPQNSMGKAIESVLKAFGSVSLVDALQANAAQLGRLLDISTPAASERIRSIVGGKLDDQASLEEFLRLAQEQLLGTFGDYHMRPMLFGLILLCASSFLVCFATCNGPLCQERRGLILCIGLVVYLATFFASSFVEEEHEFWYFAAATAFLFSASVSDLTLQQRLAALVLAATVRIMREWSFNGQKNLPNDSLSSTFSESTLALHAHLTSAFFAIVPLVILGTSARRMSRRFQNIQVPVRTMCLRALGFATLLVCVWFQVAFLLVLKVPTLLEALSRVVGDSLDLVQVARLGQALFVLIWLGCRLARSLDPAATTSFEALRLVTVSIALASLTKPSNILLWPILWLQAFAVRALELRSFAHGATIVAMQHVSSFAFGSSNSLATIDLSQAYNGVSSYDVRHVAVLTFFSNFAGPVFWSLARSQTTFNGPSRTLKSFSTSTLFYTLQLTVLSISSFHFRRHLFVWTVFSPALLYKTVWFVLVHCCSDIVLTLLLQ
ncbi:hypothetical protein ACM66B_002803 [Microbotryomycetes sp. NB124-2]